MLRLAPNGRYAMCANCPKSLVSALPGATVDVTLEVEVRVNDDVKEDVVRTVSENATALKFDHASFEKD